MLSAETTNTPKDCDRHSGSFRWEIVDKGDNKGLRLSEPLARLMMTFCRLGDIFGKMHIDHLTANAISK